MCDLPGLPLAYAGLCVSDLSSLVPELQIVRGDTKTSLFLWDERVKWKEENTNISGSAKRYDQMAF